jgi:hypothetical protein
LDSIFEPLEVDAAGAGNVSRGSICSDKTIKLAMRKPGTKPLMQTKPRSQKHASLTVELIRGSLDWAAGSVIAVQQSTQSGESKLVPDAIFRV